LYIADTVPASTGEVGRGIEVDDGGRVDLFLSAIVRSHEVGILAYDAAGFTATDTTISETSTGAGGAFGHGLTVLDLPVQLTRVTITRSASVGALFSFGGGAIRGSIFSGNGVGLHAQDGSQITATDDPPSDPLQVAVSADTRFLGNSSRVGAGAVPLPSNHEAK